MERKTAEQIFQQEFNSSMKYSNYAAFQRDYPTLLKVILSAMEAYASQLPVEGERWIPISEWDDLSKIDVRILTSGGSELNCWQQADGDFWSEELKIFITPDKVTHLKHQTTM